MSVLSLHRESIDFLIVTVTVSIHICSMSYKWCVTDRMGGVHCCLQLKMDMLR